MAGLVKQATVQRVVVIGKQMFDPRRGFGKVAPLGIQCACSVLNSLWPTVRDVVDQTKGLRHQQSCKQPRPQAAHPAQGSRGQPGVHLGTWQFGGPILASDIAGEAKDGCCEDRCQRGPEQHGTRER